MQVNNHLKFGLKERDIKTIEGIFIKHSDVEEVHLFGSRAKGNYKSGSDIDLAIITEAILPKTISIITTEFEESSLPFKVDLVHFPTLKSADFIDHIKRVGIVFYKKRNPQVLPITHPEKRPIN